MYISQRVKFYKHPIILLLGFVVSLGSQSSFAATTWLLEEGEYSLSTSYVDQAFSGFWKGDEKVPFEEIAQTTASIGASYGLSDSIQLSLMTGYTSSKKADVPEFDYTGRADSKLSIKYALSNEYTGSPITTAINLDLIIKGNYGRGSPGLPHSPGDEANGVALSLPMSRIFNRLNVVGEIGYRARFDDVPDDIFYNLGIGMMLGQRVYFQGRYLVNDAKEGLNIGADNFTQNEFHKTEEDYELIEITLSIPFADRYTVFFGLADVLSGKNTGDSDIMFLGLSYQ